MCCLAAQPAKTLASHLTDYVNPFIGTGGHGHTFPGATRPFGMVQLSPDTDDTGWDHCGGYHYPDSTIVGFSHTHLSGTGIADFADILLMPNVGPPQFRPGPAAHPETGYRSHFSHKAEQAAPGYYAVLLDEPNVRVELTATAHAGLHRYTFRGSKAGHVILDLKHGLDPQRDWGLPERVLDSQLTIEDDSTISGYRLSTGWARMQAVYFVIKLSRPAAELGAYFDGRYQAGHRQLRGENLQAAFQFADLGPTRPLLLKVGLSSVSVAGARQNLAAELPGWNFDQVREQAQQDWESHLARIRVQGSIEQKALFYTALYHTAVAPNLLSDVSGDYRGADYNVHRSPLPTYSTLSLWDTYRATHPLYTIIEPERVPALLSTFLNHCDQTGYLPIWSIWGNEAHTMIANPAVPVVVDAWRKGLLPADQVERAYAAVRRTLRRDHFNSPWEIYDRTGYMPAETEVNSVSKTLEMSYDDWCAAQMAQALGHANDYAFFLKRSQSYRRHYDPATGFFRGKTATGAWTTPFSPYRADYGSDYTEGTPWQWLWYVPHDVPGLVALLGGPARTAQRLDSLFELKTPTTGSVQDMSGFIGQYAHGNEPSHHIAYLYNYVGQPWRTQERVRHILASQYRNAPNGLSGNEDCGQMSAWYVFSALGFYPVNPADGRYVFGSPLLPEAVLTVAGGRQFRIVARRASATNQYIQSVTLNGRPYAKTYLTHADLVAGGELVFAMGPKPNPRFGSAPTASPAAL